MTNISERVDPPVGVIRSAHGPNKDVFTFLVTEIVTCLALLNSKLFTGIQPYHQL